MLFVGRRTQNTHEYALRNVVRWTTRYTEVNWFIGRYYFFSLQTDFFSFRFKNRMTQNCLWPMDFCWSMCECAIGSLKIERNRWLGTKRGENFFNFICCYDFVRDFLIRHEPYVPMLLHCSHSSLPILIDFLAQHNLFTFSFHKFTIFTHIVVDHFHNVDIESTRFHAIDTKSGFN